MISALFPSFFLSFLSYMYITHPPTPPPTHPHPGPIVSVKLTSRDPSPPPFEYVKGGGGIFKDMAVHDLGTYLSPTPPTTHPPILLNQRERRCVIDGRKRLW